MNRRDFLRSAGSVSAAMAFSKLPRFPLLAATAETWRSFDVVTRVEVLKYSGTTRIWVPAALINPAPFQKTISNSFDAGAGSAKLVQSNANSLGIVAAEFSPGVKPLLTVTSRVTTKNYAVDLSAPGKDSPDNRAELNYFLQPTKFQPVDGIVEDTATAITKGATTDIEKARAIYEWIVDNTFRNPKTRGCGLGDIRFMLESKDLGGKCADLNALYVGLARAAGIPARDAYGIRLAKSELGYKSLGPSTETVTKAQHCRAEIYLQDDDMVKKARVRLFGSWEMNWMAYNFASDVALPGSSGASIPFFMYPQAETSDGGLDPLDPDAFKYEITSKETTPPAN
jgi:hypothetical protein